MFCGQKSHRLIYALVGSSVLFFSTAMLGAANEELNLQTDEQAHLDCDTNEDDVSNEHISWLKEMKEAGYTAWELKGRGSLADFYKAGFATDDLLRTFETDDFSKAKLPSIELKKAGITARKMRIFGYSLEQLIAAEYSFESLLKAGFDPELIKNKGFWHWSRSIDAL